MLNVWLVLWNRPHTTTPQEANEDAVELCKASLKYHIHKGVQSHALPLVSCWRSSARQHIGDKGVNSNKVHTQDALTVINMK